MIFAPAKVAQNRRDQCDPLWKEGEMKAARPFCRPSTTALPAGIAEVLAGATAVPVFMGCLPALHEVLGRQAYVRVSVAF
jgi:hypothetical protein